MTISQSAQRNVGCSTCCHRHHGSRDNCSRAIVLWAFHKLGSPCVFSFFRLQRMQVTANALGVLEVSVISRCTRLRENRPFGVLRATRRPGVSATSCCPAGCGFCASAMRLVYRSQHPEDPWFTVTLWRSYTPRVPRLQTRNPLGEHASFQRCRQRHRPFGLTDVLLGRCGKSHSYACAANDQ